MFLYGMSVELVCDIIIILDTKQGGKYRMKLDSRVQKVEILIQHEPKLRSIVGGEI